MPEQVAYNLTTKKWNTYSNAVRSGLFTNPERFRIASDVFIRRDTKNNPVLSKKRAEKLLREGKIDLTALAYNKTDNLYNPKSGVFNDNNAKNIKKVDTFILVNPRSHQDRQMKSYKMREYGINIPEIDLMNASAKDFKLLERRLKDVYIYINDRKKFPAGSKFSLKFYGGGANWITTPYGTNMKSAITNIMDKAKDIPNRYNTGFGGDLSTPLVVNAVIVGVIMPNPNLAGVSKAMEILGTKQYRVISPKSVTNCLYHAWTLGEEPQNLTHYVNNNRALEQKARKLKLRVNPTLKGLSDMGTIQELCNYKKRSAIVFDSIFQIKQTITPTVDKGLSPIKLQFINNHMKACIDWKDIADAVPTTNTVEIKSSKKDENKKIVKHFTDKEHDSRIMVWDIEASRDDDKNFKAYAVGVAWEEDGDQKIEIWFGLDCLTKFMDFLHNNFEKFNGWTLYAHNGGKFDIPVLLRECLLSYTGFSIDVDKIVELNKSFIGFGLKKGDMRISMKDSLRLLPEGLDKLTKDFKVPHQKLTETISHEDITLENYNSPEYYPLIHKYLTNDCLGLLEILHTFSKSVYESTKINITECYTGASLSKKNYFKNYYNGSDTPIYTLNDNTDNFIRKGYGGGRCEAFRINTNIVGKSYYYDFTSLYPATGCQRLPYGIPIQSEFKKGDKLTAQMIGNKIGFYSVMVKTINFTKKPLHGMKDESGRYIFPHFANWTLLTAVFSQEIRMGILRGVYEYSFVQGCDFDGKPILKQFFEDAVAKKAQAKKDGNSAMEFCYKIIANSGYGFWGLRTEGRDGIKVFHDDDGGIIPLIHSNKLVDVATYGSYTFARCFDDIGVKDFNVAIASAITSYARMKLWSAINDIENLGGEVYYCDTDSIITNLDISKHESYMKKYMWDGTGDALGALKNEIEEKIYKYFKKDKALLAKQKEADGGAIHFDELIIGGCKFYSCKKTLFNGEVIEINKLKGYKQTGEDELSFNMFDDLITGKTKLISQVQNQFICPKSNYVSEEKKFGISIKPIKKDFNIIYNKGTVEGSYIKPLIK